MCIRDSIGGGRIVAPHAAALYLPTGKFVGEDWGGSRGWRGRFRRWRESRRLGGKDRSTNNEGYEDRGNPLPQCHAGKARRCYQIRLPAARESFHHDHGGTGVLARPSRAQRGIESRDSLLRRFGERHHRMPEPVRSFRGHMHGTSARRQGQHHRGNSRGIRGHQPTR